MNRFTIHKASLLKLLLVSLLFIVFIYVGRHLLINFDFKTFFSHLHDLTLVQYILLFLVGMFSISPMLLYDFVMAKLLELDYSKKDLIMFSWIANTSSNLIGFGGVAGTSLRTLYYSKSRSKKEVIKTISGVSIFMLSGISALSLLIFLPMFNTSLLYEYHTLMISAIAAVCYFPIMFIIVYFKRSFFSENFTRRIMFSLVGISIIEWMCAFLLIFFICHILSINIPFTHLFPIFIVSAVAGIISMIPGGLGSFDFVFIVGLSYFNINQETALIVMLFYRISYYIVPFVVGIIFSVKILWDRLNKSFNNLPYQMLSFISHKALAILVFLSGVVLLLSAAVPGILVRIKFLRNFLPLTVIDLSHVLSISIGFILLALSRGIDYKIKRGWYITFVMLVLGALATFSKGLDYEEAIFVLIVAFMLFQSRKQFYRENFILTWGKIVVDNFILFIFLIGYLFIGYINLPNTKIVIPNKYQQYIVADPRDLLLSASVGFAIALIFIYFYFFKNRYNKFPFVESKNQSEKIREHLNKYSGNELSHLIFLHDKYIYWAQDETVLFAFQHFADKLVILGDPVGDKNRIFEAIEELMITADLYGYSLVFYQVNSTMLSYLHENGFDFFKLGEEGFTIVQSFSLSGKKKKSLRALINKIEREGYTFEIANAPHSSQFLDTLNQISDEWLNGRKEKGYSLGYFDENYLNLTSIAIVKNSDNQIIAFANIMPLYNDKTVSVDLMRYNKLAPSGIMDFMFYHLIEKTKEQSYTRFNMGMAPLSNVGESRFSFASEKIAAQVYTYGQYFYSFQGLRHFKEKFVDHWTPKFLAYRKKTSILITMLQVTALISKGKDDDEI